jgi:RimJ/RimL family protein N-acetyltransferase
LNQEFFEVTKKHNKARRDGLVGPDAGIEKIEIVVLLFDGQELQGMGTLSKQSDKVAEIGRLFIRDNKRGGGHCAHIVKALEQYAKEKGYSHCIANVFEENESSKRTLEKYGYEKYFDFATLPEGYKKAYQGKKYYGDIYINFMKEVKLKKPNHRDIERGCE